VPTKNLPFSGFVPVNIAGAPSHLTVTFTAESENGRFFVGTKSIFNKTPKINYTHDDIDDNHSGELAKKLHVALDEFSKLGIKGVVQGDLLYTKSDLSTKTIDGESHLIFKPNTILYAVPKKSDLAKTIQSSKIGIVFHTYYTGNKMSDLKANFGYDTSRLTKTKSVWFTDAYFKDTSGNSTLTKKKTEEVTKKLSEVGKLFRKLNPKIINYIVYDEKLRMLIHTYNNSKVRSGQRIGNVKRHVNGLMKFIQDRYNKEISQLKTQGAKDRRVQAKTKLINQIINNREQLYYLFQIQELLVDAKLILIRQLEKAKNLGTFLETPNGLKVTAPEGFVGIDRLGDSALKLVDRLEFSRANFNLPKNWSK
jgi:hypothetical protein